MREGRDEATKEVFNGLRDAEASAEGKSPGPAAPARTADQRHHNPTKLRTHGGGRNGPGQRPLNAPRRPAAITQRCVPRGRCPARRD